MSRAPQTLPIILASLGAAALALCPALRAADARPEISVKAPVVALVHARVIDGLGTPASLDQTIVIRDGRIAALGAPDSVAVPAGATVIDLSGKTVIPGLVMLHEHMYYAVRVGSHPFHTNQMDYSFPRLYLACGITTIRTGGSVEPYADMEIRRRVEAGEMPGPRIHLTAPYIEGPPSPIAQLHAVSGPEDAVSLVNYWADQGFTSIKLYMHVTPEVAGAAIAAAHKRGMKATGHIGALTYGEAADLGIDDLEHGFFASTDFVRGKKVGEIPLPTVMDQSLETLRADSPGFDALVAKLIGKGVAITSTLSVFEGFVAGRPLLSARELEVMSEPARENYLAGYARYNRKGAPGFAPVFENLMKLEKVYSDRGGLLVAGTDPTGAGNAIAGFGSLREVELLVEAGFSPVQAIHVASLNGARFLGVDKDVGSIEAGKLADLVVVAGDPSASIQEIRKVETVFKGGVGYDAQVLVDSVRGCVGIE